MGQLPVAGLLRTADFREVSELLVDVLLDALLTDSVRACGEMVQDSVTVANGALLGFGFGENEGEEVGGGGLSWGLGTFSDSSLLFYWIFI